MVTTHFMDEAEYCDRISLVYRGKIINMDTPDNLKDKAQAVTLEEAFIKMIEDYDRR
jgi:ABC-2 type transport system ATP-binding protein